MRNFPAIREIAAPVPGRRFGLELDPVANMGRDLPRPKRETYGTHTVLRSIASDRAVAAAVDQWAESGRQVERGSQVEPALDHRRIDNRSGVAPAWAASNSAWKS